MKIVMFHYVRNSNKKFEFFKHYEKKKFLKLIKKYKNKIISKESEIYKNPKKILLTFDDGLTDHFAVAKQLFKKQLIGIFFIPYLPYKNKKILNVHMSHLILGKVGGKIALNEMEKYINFKKFKNYINLKEKKIFSSRYIDQKTDIETKQFKKIVNYYGNFETTYKILKFLIKKFNIKFKFSDIYLTQKQIKKMHKMGMIIGCHSTSHLPLSKLSYKKQFSEINGCKKFIEKITKQKCLHFCFPYGRKNSYNKNTLTILKKLKFNLGYSVENRSVSKNDIKKYYFELPRYDCNLIT